MSAQNKAVLRKLCIDTQQGHKIFSLILNNADSAELL